MATEPSSNKAVSERSTARLAAVQALYQIEVGPDASVEGVIEEFCGHRLGKEIDGTLYANADHEFFRDVVGGVAERRAEIDELLEGALKANWRLDRLETLMASILRAGIYELLARPDVPTAVVIDEYLDVAHAFYARSEPRFVNGILDQLARKLRG